MATKAWQVNLDDGEHYVELDHGTFSGKCTVKVDDQVVVQEGMNIIDFGDKIEVPIGNQQGLLEISTEGLTFDYSLKVNGRLVPAID